MSTRFESASSERAQRASVSVSTALTLGGYVYLHSLPSVGAYAPIVTVYGSFDGFTILVDSAGKIRIGNYSGDTISTAGTATLATSTWHYLWIRLDAAGFGEVSVYLNGSTTADKNGTFLAIPASPTFQFASNQAGFTSGTFSVWYADVSLDAWKAWSADRAASNAATEDDAHAMSSTTSAIAAWWFDGTDINDHQNTNHLTATGTLSAGPNSPIDGSGGATFQAAWARGSNVVLTPGVQAA